MGREALLVSIYFSARGHALSLWLASIWLQQVMHSATACFSLLIPQVSHTPSSCTNSNRLQDRPSPHLLVKLHVVGREQAHLSVELASPPVIVREFDIGNLGILGEADF